MEDLPWTGERLVTNVENYTMIEHLHRYSITVDLVKDKVVLDIASGEGYGSSLLSTKASYVYGIDINEESVKHADSKYKRDNLIYKHGSADQIPVDDASIDVVVSFETLEHHDKHEEMLAEIKRILKPDGILVMSTPDKVIPENNPFHVKELTNQEFKHLIKAYFKHTAFYFQRIVMGSLIVAQEDISLPFRYHTGTYNQVSSQHKLEDAVYNICIASNSALSNLTNSFFEGERILIDSMLKPYKNSILYRISNWIKKGLN